MQQALVNLARLLQLHDLLRRLQVRQVHVRDHVGQPPPLLHTERGGLLDVALDHGEVRVVRVADGEVAAVEVDAPARLPRVAQLHQVERFLQRAHQSSFMSLRSDIGYKTKF